MSLPRTMFSMTSFSPRSTARRQTRSSSSTRTMRWVCLRSLRTRGRDTIDTTDPTVEPRGDLDPPEDSMDIQEGTDMQEGTETPMGAAAEEGEVGMQEEEEDTRPLEVMVDTAPCTPPTLPPCTEDPHRPLAGGISAMAPHQGLPTEEEEEEGGPPTDMDHRPLAVTTDDTEQSCFEL
ncbi:hypothetical protein GBAR_LOCUS8964 [Geodia barretti]|nr:hypothetical protein GBAR_LOCUS8964 [Geodia barretti]